jgi:thiol-disulfide isomerase/thioredoxin
MKFPDLRKFLSNPVNVLMAAVVLYVAWNLYSNYGAEEGFESELSDRPVIVLYHLPGCGWCKKMMPEWDKFQKAHKGDSDVSIKKIDCSKKPEAAEKEGIKGFPTIIKFKDGEKEGFDGDRTAEALEGFLRA